MFNSPLTIKSKVQRAIPLKAQLLASDGTIITPSNIVGAAPVVSATFTGPGQAPVSVDTSDLLPKGASSSGNTFSLTQHKHGNLI